MDSSSRRLYIGRTTRAMVVNMDAGTLIGEIPGNGVHGVAIAPAAKRGFISNGKDDTVTIFNLDTLAVVGQVTVGKKPDAILYEPASNQIFVSDNGATMMTVLSVADSTVKGSIELAGAPESAVADGKGHVYANLEDTNEVVEIDATAMKATHHWQLKGTTPTGLAIDREHRRLFSGCRGTKTLEVLNADLGTTIASLPIGSGVDAAVFDPASGMAFASCKDGTMTIVHEDTSDAFTVVQNVQTKPGAKTMTFDDKTGHALLVALDGQFSVLEVGR